MGSLRYGRCGRVTVVSLLLIILLLIIVSFLPACGGHKPAGSSPFPVKITLSPSPSLSLQLGSVEQFSATAVNNADSHVSPTFTYAVSPSSPAGVLDVAPNGAACAGSWNAPLFTICTPGNIGVVEVAASALGASSSPTMVFVHPAIASIQISFVPSVNSPPPACPNQIALPAACQIKFNADVCKGQPNEPCSCLSANQTETLQATARDSEGNDITPSVGPFTWSASNASVATLTPIVNPSYNVPTNQVTVSPGTPGQTQIIASASGVSSQPSTVSPIVSTFETCPVQCIDLELGANGEFTGQTSFVTTKGTSETVTATAVDIQGCIVAKPSLTWTSSQPAAISPGGATGCSSTASCALSTSQPGAASVTASCTPPTCNIGFPLNLNPTLGAPYIPQPVYPVTAISGLVTGAASSTSVLASSQDCFSNPECGVVVYDIATSKNVPGSPTTLPNPPNSLMFDLAGDKAYMGSEFGAIAINPTNLGTSTNPFTSLTAAATPRGVVTGKVIAISNNGGLAIFSDTVSTPNQVYAVNTASSTPITTPLNINAAIAATFSPDGLKAFILGDGGTSLYVYSQLQSLQLLANPLPSPAKSIVFNSTGSFALLSGGGAAGDLAVYNTCDNSLLNPSLSQNLPAPPLFLKMVPSGNVFLSSALIPVPLDPAGLDFFFGVDNTGIDIIATNTSLVPLPVPPGPLTLGTLCPQDIVIAQSVPPNPPSTFPPTHININHGTFNPINFFLSPDNSQLYIVTSDQGILLYSFNTGAVTAIPLSGGAAPLAADITVDGTLIYVAASDGQLHQLVTGTASEQISPISFPPLPNSANSFCDSSYSCALDLLTIKP